MLTGKNVLLTGGAGSVGQALVPHILDADPGVLRILDNSEPGLADIKRQLDDSRLRFLAGDVRDSDRLERAMENIDIVIHTAAMKHVDVCEYNPFEAVKTNVLGIQNIVDTAIDASVQRVVFTSSDKAVDPANTMGTTKLLGERLLTAGNKHSGRSDLRFTSVRFGNILNSSQSVVPLFDKQIREGGPVTLTDTQMTRFFLTYDDVFDLITQAIEKTEGGEVFVYKMPAIRIEDLAEAMIEVFAPQYDHDPNDIDIEIIGRRPGETFHEEIMTERETNRAYENDTLYAIRPEANEYLSYENGEEFDPADDIVRSSGIAPQLSTDEIVTLLRETDAVEVTNE
jgi:FlaA1/EpsC-like NDP-sugar epimerase